MARRWSDSYRVRLAVGYLLVVALFAGAWSWSLFGPLTSAIIEQQQSNLGAVARAGVQALGQTDATAQKTVDRLVAGTNLRMTIIAADGTVLADSEEPAAGMENHANRPEIAAALLGLTGTDRRVSNTQDVEQIYLAVPASFHGQKAALRVSESLARINDLAGSSRRVGLLALLAVLVVTIAVVTRLTAAATGPIERLSASARSMAAGDLDASVPSESRELSILSDALSELRTQMKQRISDLSAEEGNLRAVLNGLTDAVFLLHGEEVRFANSAASSLLRTSVGGWRGRRFSALGLPASIVSAVRDAGDEPATTECGPDPQGRHLKLTVLPLNPSDQHTRTLAVITDITQLTNIDHVRRDFVANASHELKTPTAGIHLLAEAAATAAADGDMEQAVQFASQIAAESARLARLVSDLLDLSRLESAPQPGAMTDVREAVSNALIGHRSAAAAAGLALNYDENGADGQDAYALADPTDLAVALDNLLENAIKYTESGGITIKLAVDASMIRILISDTGIGIPAEDLTRVFERFYRVDRARSRDSGGTGLGLALVRHVVERSGGSVEVTSETDQGTTFALELPRAGLARD
ncbi:MAG: ATP-binding protein [Coriobacteriia bacterium]|nr:ATP-binding protein [Coriobacteriia bacterium]